MTDDLRMCPHCKRLLRILPNMTLIQLLERLVDQIDEPLNAEHVLGAFRLGASMAEARRVLGRKQT